MRRAGIVNGSGPLTAQLLIVGEAPGPTEVAKGYPFAGRTGGYVRSILRDMGLETGSIRFNNVLPFNPGKISTASEMRRLVHQNWSHLENDLSHMQPKVIVALGRTALYRLTAFSSILRYQMSTWCPANLPEQVVIPGRNGPTTYDIGLPSDCIVIALQHPAAVMRTKIGASYMLIERGLRRAGAYVRGQLRFDQGGYMMQGGLGGENFIHQVYAESCIEEVDAALENASIATFDTEFQRDTKIPFLCGVSVDGKTVYSMNPTNPDHRKVLQRHLLRRDLLKVAQYHVADTGALSIAGYDTCAPWFDTIEGFSHLYPDLPLALPFICHFYFPGLHNWKDMHTEDRNYNALDVALTHRAATAIIGELKDADMYEVFMNERMPTSLLMHQLEMRGLHVDMKARTRAITRHRKEDESYLVRVKEVADRFYQRRIDEVENELRALLAKLREIEERVLPSNLACPVPKHANYIGLGKKRFSTKNGCTCKDIYYSIGGVMVRLEKETIDKELAPLKAKLKRWTSPTKEKQPGFDPGNNEHLRWILYDTKGFGLRTQYKEGSPTADADAIARILASKELAARDDADEIRGVLEDIKHIQHLRKMRSTFLFEGKGIRRIDQFGVVHPPYRAFGTGPGRPAGGGDSATEERAVNPYAFNALNIPKEARSIYTPRSADCLQIHPNVFFKSAIERVLEKSEEDSEA